MEPRDQHRAHDDRGWPWNAGADAYLVPQPGNATATVPGGGTPLGVAIFDAGPRYNPGFGPTAAAEEPYEDYSQPSFTLGDAAANAADQARWWRESAQAAALSTGDVSPFCANVDFAKLAAGANDESNVPKTGPIDRIFASHYQFGQGFDESRVCFDLASNFSAGAHCVGRLVGQLQSYALYVPGGKPQPPHGWGMTLLLHSLSANYNQYSGTRNQSELGDRGTGNAGAHARGTGTRRLLRRDRRSRHVRGLGRRSPPLQARS